MGWVFLRQEEVVRIHAKVIQLFGGSEGIRDQGALSSALIAVENRLNYENADLAACAATYAYHLTQAHAFVDGNKRVGAAVAEIFIEINGGRLLASNEQIVDLFLRVAAGELLREETEEVSRSLIVPKV